MTCLMPVASSIHRHHQADAISNRLAAKYKREGAVDGIGHEGAHMGAYQFSVNGARSHQNRNDPASSAGIEELASRSDHPPVDITPHPAARRTGTLPIAV